MLDALTKILPAVTVFNSCQPIQCDAFAAKSVENQSCIHAETVMPESLASCCTDRPCRSRDALQVKEGMDFSHASGESDSISDGAICAPSVICPKMEELHDQKPRQAVSQVDVAAAIMESVTGDQLKVVILEQVR